jgi:NAD(P)-dependent dehydrogenase (short-subunit alcohol dehydrogenase family)
MTEYKATILITGGTSGLGKATAEQLAVSQPNRQIIITGRSPRGVADEINTLTGRSNVIFLSLDLSTNAGARDFAKRFLDANYPPIETFYFNAALQFVDGLHTTEDGIEESFAVNHLNQSLVFFLLKGQLTDDARIVVVGSSVHDPTLKRIPLDTVWTNSEDAARPAEKKETSPWGEGLRRYGLSKAANMLFTYALADKVNQQGKKWTVTCLDPGVMPTNLLRHLGPWLAPPFNYAMGTFLGRRFVPDILPAAKVAEQLVRMGYDRSWHGEGVHGVYFGTKGQVVRSSEASHNLEFQKELWEWTVKELTLAGEEAKFERL